MEQTGGAAADRNRTAIVVIAIAVLAFALRAIHPPPAGTFASNDALYHVRFAENLAAHFPAWSTFDPYLRPEGGRVPVAPLLGFLITGLSLPAGHLEAIATWLPPLLGALAIVPMFFLARRNGWVAALLLAILPGEFLARSRAGNTDHHVLEVLLMLATLWMLRRAIENEQRGSAVGAGVFLALYCFAWSSAAMGVAILIAVSLFAPRAAKPFAWMFGSATLIVAPFVLLLPRGRLTIVLLLIGAVVTSISALRGPRLALLTLLIAAGLAIALAPHTARVFRNYAALLMPDAMSRTVIEGRSLLHADGWTIVWQQFALAGVAALVGLVLLARERRTGDVILFWTSIAFLASAIAQRRFLYYAAACVAFLAAFALARLTSRQRIASVALIVASIALAPAWHAGPPRDMTPAMREAVTFLRDHTPEPFADPSVYFERFTTTTAPRAAYSVLAWWDHGYAVVRTARRVPTSNPTQAGARATAAFLLEQDESAAAPIAERLRARYVVVDSSLMILRPLGNEASIGGTLAQVAVWNGEQPSRYFEQYLYGDRLVWLFYPEYFRSMAARLYLFGGGASRPDFVVATFREEGERKRIVALQRFARYRDAMNAVLLDPAQHKRLVSIDPRQSCVPVEALVHYAPVFDNGAVRVFERR